MNFISQLLISRFLMLLCLFGSCVLATTDYELASSLVPDRDLSLSTGVLICENGEKICFSDGCEKPKNPIVRIQKDGPIVYMQDSGGNLYSFEVDSSYHDGAISTVKRTQIFRLPLLGQIYNLFYPNTLKLSIAENGDFSPWAMSYVNYDGKDCVTISLFEMINANPVVIRNRDPWLMPWQNHTHQGPSGFVGVDIASGGKWVAVSGFYQGRKAFAYKALNYDLAGQNFLAYYHLQDQEGITWAPDTLTKKVLGNLSTPKDVIPLPTPEWTVVNLEDYHQPHVFFIEQGAKLMVPLIEGLRSFYDVYDVNRQRWISGELPILPKETYNTYLGVWPKIVPICGFSEVRFRVSVNDQSGSLRLVYGEEPLFGVFFSHREGYPRKIYKVRRTLKDFLFNHLRYFDEKGNSINLRFL